MADVTTEFVRRHYAQGPTAYNEDGSIARMPTSADVEYAGHQFDRWLATHDAAVRADMQQRINRIGKMAVEDGVGSWVAHQELVRKIALAAPTESEEPDHE